MRIGIVIVKAREKKNRMYVVSKGEENNLDNDDDNNQINTD